MYALSATGGVRFHMLATDGLRSHPRVRLLEGKSGLERAEYVIYLPNSAPWYEVSECNEWLNVYMYMGSSSILLQAQDRVQCYHPGDPTYRAG